MIEARNGAVADVEAIALALADAARRVTPVPPISESHPQLDVDDAYAIQTAGRRLALARGARVVGHKIGLTSAAMQKMVGVGEPDYGYLLDRAVHRDGARLEAGAFIAPRVEAEIAFRLAAVPAAAEPSVDDVLAVTEAVCVALEVIDSRIADWRITIVDTIADNASCGGAVLGAWVDPSALDLAALPMRLTVGARTVDGRGDAVLGHPARSVAWLARCLRAQGETFEAGEIVLSGALARALPVGDGDRATATIDGLGTVSAEFAAASGDPDHGRVAGRGAGR